MKKMVLLLMVVMGISANANGRDSAERQLRMENIKFIQIEDMERVNRKNNDSSLNLSVEEVVKKNLERDLGSRRRN